MFQNKLKLKIFTLDESADSFLHQSIDCLLRQNSENSENHRHNEPKVTSSPSLFAPAKETWRCLVKTDHWNGVAVLMSSQNTRLHSTAGHQPLIWVYENLPADTKKEKQSWTSVNLYSSFIWRKDKITSRPPTPEIKHILGDEWWWW